MNKKLCKCTSNDSGYLVKECKYCEVRCHHWDCNKKLKKDESEYCQEHQAYWDEQGELGVDAFGGSDF